MLISVSSLPVQNPRIAAVGGASPAMGGGGSPNPQSSPRPTNPLAAAAAAIAPHDSEKVTFNSVLCSIVHFVNEASKGRTALVFSGMRCLCHIVAFNECDHREIHGLEVESL